MKNNLPSPARHLLCFSHLRWEFVFQRPPYLLSRIAKYVHVYFLEEPIFDTKGDAHFTFFSRAKQLDIVVPHLPKDLDGKNIGGTYKELIRHIQNQIIDHNISIAS